MVDRVRRDFSNDDVLQISDTYYAWRGQSDAVEKRGAYEDVSGFCHSTSLEDIKTNNYVLTLVFLLVLKKRLTMAFRLKKNLKH